MSKFQVKCCCVKCKQETTTGQLTRNHIDTCPIISTGIKEQKIIWNKGLTKDIDERCKRNGESISKTLLGRPGRPHTAESKKHLSNIAKLRGFGGHTSKQKIYFERKDGSVIYLHSSYEIRFANILEELGIKWERPDPLNWVDDNGEVHRYYPDFKIGFKYIDTKNDYLAKIDARKIELVKEQNDIDLQIVTEKQINIDFVKALL